MYGHLWYNNKTLLHLLENNFHCGFLSGNYLIFYLFSIVMHRCSLILPVVLLQEKKLLELPKLLDICAIYYHENEELTRSLVRISF